MILCPLLLISAAPVSAKSTTSTTIAIAISMMWTPKWSYQTIMEAFTLIHLASMTVERG
jgi:hypothetical protein